VVSLVSARRCCVDAPAGGRRADRPAGPYRGPVTSPAELSDDALAEAVAQAHAEHRRVVAANEGLYLSDARRAAARAAIDTSAAVLSPLAREWVLRSVAAVVGRPVECVRLVRALHRRGPEALEVRAVVGEAVGVGARSDDAGDASDVSEMAVDSGAGDLRAALTCLAASWGAHGPTMQLTSHRAAGGGVGPGASDLAVVTAGAGVPAREGGGAHVRTHAQAVSSARVLSSRGR